ncbi:hypothetical protein [Thalassovita sp.]|uniref:hypothetical protein n=1 Tax=Thalassovita sp. TaxID=1979401 RepID=UPI0029DE5A59|nr:hypothetical protein [Thalassovita sp.]
MALSAANQTDPVPLDDSTLRAIQLLRTLPTAPLQHADCDSLIHALVQEIEETALPRQLSLSGPDTEFCSLTVAHRGLVGYSFPTPPKDQLAPGSTNAQAEAEYFLRCLLGLCPAAGPFQIHRVGPVTLGPGTDPLCFASHLQSAQATVVSSPADKVFARFQSRARAWLLLSHNTDSSRQAQTPADLALLETFATHLPAPVGENGANGFAHAPCCTLFHRPEDAIVAVVTDRFATRLLLLDRTDRNDLQQEWARCMKNAPPTSKSPRF